MPPVKRISYSGFIFPYWAKLHNELSYILISSDKAIKTQRIPGSEEEPETTSKTENDR